MVLEADGYVPCVVEPKSRQHDRERWRAAASSRVCVCFSGLSTSAFCLDLEPAVSCLDTTRWSHSSHHPDRRKEGSDEVK